MPPARRALFLTLYDAGVASTITVLPVAGLLSNVTRVAVQFASGIFKSTFPAGSRTSRSPSKIKASPGSSTSTVMPEGGRPKPLGLCGRVGVPIYEEEIDGALSCRSPDPQCGTRAETIPLQVGPVGVELAERPGHHLGAGSGDLVLPETDDRVSVHPWVPNLGPRHAELWRRAPVQSRLRRDQQARNDE